MEEKLYYEITEIPYKRISRDRVLTGYSRLDYAIKGIETGITLLVGNTNSGKSTFIQGLLAQTINQGRKAWIFSGEHTASSFLQLLYHQNSKPKDYMPVGFKDIDGNDTNIVDWYITPEKEKELNAKFKNNIFFYSNKAKRDIDNILKSMELARKQDKVSVFFVDNLISIDNIDSNVFAEQTRITEKLRTFALNNEVTIILVAHQRKISDRGFRIDIQDVAGSQNISNKAYNVLALYRTDMLSKDRDDYKILERDLLKSGFDLKQCDSVVEVLKTKGNGNALVGLKYNAETKTYTQSEILTKTKADEIFKQRAVQTDMTLIPIPDDEVNDIF